MSENNKIILQYIKDLRILYLEDDENTRGMVEFFLKGKVKNLYVGEDGSEGFDLYKKYSPDLIITDIQMPNMTGTEMAKLIRDENSEIPIIVKLRTATLSHPFTFVNAQDCVGVLLL